MRTCETCGNQYDKTFEVTLNNEVHIFDSFECAISRLAPRCDHCGTRVIGHGVEANERIYCCVHCAEFKGEMGLRDRSEGIT